MDDHLDGPVPESALEGPLPSVMRFVADYEWLGEVPEGALSPTEYSRQWTNEVLRKGDFPFYVTNVYPGPWGVHLVQFWVNLPVAGCQNTREARERATEWLTALFGDSVDVRFCAFA